MIFLRMSASHITDLHSVAMSWKPFRRTQRMTEAAEGDGGDQREDDEPAARRLDAELEQARAELERLNADTLEVARHFEGEAAARAEAEAAAEQLRRENAQLLAEIDELRTRLTRKEAAGPG
jgi:chromosome segregation ATPase